MITGCSCIRPVSKTNRSYIYQQFKAAGRDCRCPVGFLRVSPSSYCGSICYLDCDVNWGIERSRSRKLYRDICTPHGYEYHCHYRYPEIRSALINNATANWKKIVQSKWIHRESKLKFIYKWYFLCNFNGKYKLAKNILSSIFLCIM